MAEGESTGKGITGFLSKDTAGLPNWAWLLVVGAGVAAVYIVPKFLPGSSSGTSSSTSSTGSTSGLGLAVDPTTGLPYAVEGLVPSGGTAGGTLPVNGAFPPPPSGLQQMQPYTSEDFRTANGTNDTFQGYSSYFGTPLARLQDLNPQLYQQYGATGVLPQGTQIAVMANTIQPPTPQAYTPAWPGGTQQVRLTSG